MNDTAAENGTPDPVPGLREASVQLLESKLPSYKGRITTATKALIKAIDRLQNRRNDENAELVRRDLIKYRLQVEKILFIYDLILDLIDTTGDALIESERRRGKHEDDLTNLTERARDVLDAHARTQAEARREQILQQQADNAAQANNANQRQPPLNDEAAPDRRRCKPETTLKPKELTIDFTPVEAHMWCQKFEGYYKASNMDVLPIFTQQAHARSCISEALMARLEEHITEDLPILPDEPDDDSWIKAIKTEFLEAYPLLDRRYAAMKISQKGNERFCDYAKRLKDAMEQANMQAGLTKDDLLSLLYIVGAADETLRKEFLKEDAPTVADLERLGRAHDRANKGIKKEDTSQATIQKINPKQNPGVNGANKNGQKAIKINGSNGQKGESVLAEAIRIHRPDMEGRCTYCGERSHNSRDCSNKDKFTCATCSNKHRTDVCLRDAISRVKEARKGRAGGTAQSRQVSAAGSGNEPMPQFDEGQPGPLSSLRTAARVNMIAAASASEEREPIREGSASSAAHGAHSRPISAGSDASVQRARAVSRDTPSLLL